MKKHVLIIFLALMLACGCAKAAPELTGVFPGDVSLIIGQDDWHFTFGASEGGTLAMQLLSGDTGDLICDLGAMSVEAGRGRIGWNGLLADGSACAPGDYMIAAQLRNYWGEESETALMSLQLYASERDADEDALDLSKLLHVEEAIAWEEPAADAQTQINADAQDGGAQLDEDGAPVATSFWDMNPDAYDLDNPAHQRAIWDLMMQPITVIEGDQTENIYITNQPGVSYKPYSENCAGELHGQSQGVRILEDDTDGDGYVLIEAYTNDGTKSENSYMESIAADRIQGYIKKSRLYTQTPSDKYALLVDKLRQRMYVFEEGAIIGELLVSTGLNNESQPYNETPAGEFLIVSWTGDFKAGSRTIGKYALRINGGTLIHEVLHDVARDGKTKLYDAYEKELGKKASHGCVRVQRRKNEQGMNMQWLWDNMKMNTRVFIWDDAGRMMYDPEIPDPATPLFRNPDGGSNYHLDQNCPGVREKFLPLSGGFTYGDLESDEYRKLTPCVHCAAPAKLKTLYEQYVAAAEQIGATIPDGALAAFGMEK